MNEEYSVLCPEIFMAPPRCLEYLIYCRACSMWNTCAPALCRDQVVVDDISVREAAPLNSDTSGSQCAGLFPGTHTLHRLLQHVDGLRHIRLQMRL